MYKNLVEIVKSATNFEPLYEKETNKIADSRFTIELVSGDEGETEKDITQSYTIMLYQNKFKNFKDESEWINEVISKILANLNRNRNSIKKVCGFDYKGWTKTQSGNQVVVSIYIDLFMLYR